MDRDKTSKEFNEENINSSIQFAYEQSGELTDIDVEEGRKKLSKQYEKESRKQKK
ncbi:MAG: hypothetical protein M0Z65_05495 [Firmicutes bacterium]|uniref:Uncharacterized protein n=1 Tax=Melghirimyces thermohalophilus TaxID=1236220 RepID=A0A1G6KDD4_9BACL|nr:hypothetical protein [Melghirimyces thermohalophilus]MDA8352635.1 hypothetical protein [Bacillota bacterium]SDC28937.1 hypothetical protein SAMN04488112_105188 [Melghirimyces thermohalophilus]